MTHYRPDLYNGKDPYIYISCHGEDKSKVSGILKKMNQRGFRFWMDDGITPGMDRDEVLAEHIEQSRFFIAFLSEKYLNSLDMLDELNFSRDVDKDYLLIYLEEASLPVGVDMRFMRAQNVKAYSMDEESVFEQILNIGNAKEFYGIADQRFWKTAERVMKKLEKLYPEHKIFALDAVGKQLSKELSELYLKAGYPSAERLLADYGFTKISNQEARLLRNSVLYQPGFEPDVIKPRIDYIMNTLSTDYPDKVIWDSLAKKHKSIMKSLQGISVWMGYDSAADMLTAYGFTGSLSEAGRHNVDHETILIELRSRYEKKKKAKTLTQLQHDNPDLSAHLKTLSNRSFELFGMPLLAYLKSIGLIVPEEKEEKTSLTAKNREEIIENIRQLYETEASGYGTYEEAEAAFNQLVVKKNVKGMVSVSDCNLYEETMKIPMGIDVIGKGAFSGQTELVHLILPPSVKEIREDAFSGCSGLETITFSEGLEKIDNLAFADCIELKKIVLPATLKRIGNEAFAGCENLEEVEFGNLRINIQEDAFDDCIFCLDELQEQGASPAEYFELKVDRKNNAKILKYTGEEEVVVIPQMIGGHPVTSIEKGSFKGNTSIREVYINDRIGAVNGDAFRDCTNLTKIHISNSVSALTGTAFAGCTNLTEVNIPDNMTEVQRGVFKDAPLTTLYVGKGVKKISPDAFYKGEADFATGMYLKKKVLETITVDPENEFLTSDGTMLLSKDGRILYAELGDPMVAFIPEGVEEICPSAYEKISVLCEVTFPSTLKLIGEKAFAGTGVKKVEFPVSLEEIGIQAFSYCRELAGADFNEGLRVIGIQAFEGCPIEDVYLPASLKQLGKDSFLAISTYQGQIVQKFRVDNGNENLIADGVAFYQKEDDGWTLLKAYDYDLKKKTNEESPAPMEYEVKDGTTVISAHAFARCNNLAAVTLPDSLLLIEDMAFWDCSGLKEIRIPAGCTNVSPKAFFGITAEIIKE